jgi:RNA polymerase sigma-70 factor, ECF subfamily
LALQELRVPCFACFAQLIELVYFGGFTQIEIADSMGVSNTTIERDLRVTRAWLKAVMTK